MVTPPMQQQPSVIYGPNGERAEWNGREYVVASPAAPASSGYQLQPMVTPAEQRQREERQYDRERDTVRDQLTASREDRANASAARQAAAAERAAENLTVEQSKALQYGTMMRGAETDYQAALASGYHPASGRNAAANLLDGIPWDGGAIPALIRDSQSDRGYQAERRWAEANLRQMTGAAATQPEITRVAGINFDRANDELSDQRYRTREDTYGATRMAAGVARDQLPEDYPDQSGLNIRDLEPGETPESLAASGRVRGADGVWRYPRDEQGNPIFPEDAGPAAGPSGPSGSDGGSGPSGGGDNGGLLRGVADEGYQTALAQERAGLARRGENGVRRYDQPDFMGRVIAPINDEIGYASGFLGQGISNIARELSGRPIEVSADDRGRAVQALTREGGQRFASEHPFQNFAAQALGGAALMGRTGAPVTPPPAVTRTLGQRALALGGRMVESGAIGGAYGFAEADGTVAERLPQAGMTAAVSALAVPAVERIAAPAVNALANNPATRFLGRQIGAAGERMGVPGANALSAASQPNTLREGMNLFADRMGPERVNALNPRLAEQRGLGMDEATLVDVLDDGSVGRMRALNTRDTRNRGGAVRFAEGRHRNLPSRSARIAREEISPDTRPTLEVIEGLAQARRAAARTGSANFANQTVRLEDNVATALGSPLIRSTLGRAAEVMEASLDPAERQAAEYIRQLAAGNAGRGAMLTVREVQDITKGLNTAARTAFNSENPTAGPTLRSLSDAIREAGRTQSDDYARFLERYSDDMGLEEAATTGRNLVSVSRDPINARGTSAFVARAENAPAPELAVQRVAGREAWEAASSNPSGARTTLAAAASDVDQGRRLAAIGADPQRIAARSQAELDAVTAAQRASPRVGSESVTNATDAADAFGAVVQAVRRPLDAAAGWVGSRLTSRGFSNAEAEAIGAAARDPARTDELIGMLAQRMNRREARSLARAIRYQLTTGLQSTRQN